MKVLDLLLPEHGERLTNRHRLEARVLVAFSAGFAFSTLAALPVIWPPSHQLLTLALSMFGGYLAAIVIVRLGGSRTLAAWLTCSTCFIGFGYVGLHRDGLLAVIHPFNLVIPLLAVFAGGRRMGARFAAALTLEILTTLWLHQHGHVWASNIMPANRDFALVAVGALAVPMVGFLSWLHREATESAESALALSLELVTMSEAQLRHRTAELCASHQSVQQEMALRLKACEQLAESERLRAQSERMALVGQLAAGVAHEINNPLAFVISNLIYLDRSFHSEDQDPREVRIVLDEMRVGLKRIAAIVGDLTSFSREPDNCILAVNLRVVLDDATRMASPRLGSQVQLLVELPADIPDVVANERHLSQVLLNLIANAADALAASGQAAGRIGIRAACTAGQVRIDVDDSGTGLPPNVLAKLFQPFFTTKPPGKGTGLGLAISREYLRRFGGDLAATALPGGGARFTVTLHAASPLRRDTRSPQLETIAEIRGVNS